MNGYYLAVAVLSAGITALLGLWMIPVLRRLKFGQTILDIGPSWHKSKEGTPTMGGLMFIAGIILSAGTVFISMLMQNPALSQGVYKLANARFIAGLAAALGFSLIGFWDDYMKIVKKQNLGLTAKQKLMYQFLIAAGFLWALVTAGDLSTSFYIPFFGLWKAGFAYYPLSLLGIVFVVNSVNLTDGIDGLASSVTVACSLGFFVAAVLLKLPQIAILAAATAGGCLGFLVYNAFPAKVFMGDTGSMFLGGCVIAMAFGVGLPLLLALFGIVYLCESISVVLQVISFKTTKKRIFRMSPIHHHFEMGGMSETQIVTAFTAAAIAGSAVGILAVLLMR